MPPMNSIKEYLTSLIILLSSVLLTQIAHCATPIYQVSEVQGNFLQVPLTHDIYRYSQQADLQDLDVLDAQQNSLPYRLVSVAPHIKQAEPSVITTSLAFFPVATDATPDTLRKLHRTQVKVEGDTIQTATTDKTLSNTTPEFYLVDLSGLDHDLTSLSIDWVAQTNSQYLEVELEATRNLHDWFSLARSALVQINQDGQSVKRNHMDVNIAKNDYQFLRLRILRGAENLHISAVTAEQKIGALAEAQTTQETWKLVGEIAKSQTTVYLPSSHSKSYAVAAWEFTRNEATPIDTLTIDIGAHPYGDSVKIFSRKADNQNWQLQHQGIWFNAQIGSQWQKSNPVDVYRNRDKYWRVELNESAKNNSTPSLVFAWQPTQLQIIANNKPPYVLAINTKNNSYNRDQIFNQILSAANPVWVNAGLIQLNVQPESIAGAQMAIDWKQWLFWVALMLAVGVLLVFSLKLFKQLNVNKAS
jgi:hypothetical protein